MCVCVCMCVCVSVCMHVSKRVRTGRATESRTEREGTEQRTNVFVCICVCVSEWAVKHVSQGFSNLITKSVVIHHVPYKSQLPLESCNRTGILQGLSDPEQMLQAQAAGLNIHVMHFLPPNFVQSTEVQNSFSLLFPSFSPTQTFSNASPIHFYL